MRKTDCSDDSRIQKAQQKPNCEEILKGLKDFQKNTVDYVFSRLYTEGDCTRRFLVADEVGLGKTLVARGVIAKAIDLLWEKGVPRIDIIYICSNSNIASQNISKLYFLGDGAPHASRISLMPSKIKDLKKQRINFIALTPGTSFEMSSGTGIGEERALLYWMLKDEWNLDDGKPMKVFHGGMNLMNFKRLVKKYPKENIDQELKTCFLSLLQGCDEKTKSNSGISLKRRLQKLSRDFEEPGLGVQRKKWLEKESNRCISELRALLVRSCLKALEPDLIILDEFQRFKHLMYSEEGEDESELSARELAGELFTYADENSEARVLLLSATPYKMYTTADEKGVEDHYIDFLRTFEFLANDPNNPAKSSLMTKECKSTIREYREELFRIGMVDDTRLMTLKKSLEAQLSKVMVRTERLVASEDRNGMLEAISDGSTRLESGDLMAYCGLQMVADSLDCRDALEYWKSSPYPLNFMYEYDLKNALDKAVSSGNREICDRLSAANGLLLPWKDIDDYGKIDPGNARLRSLFSRTIGINAWKLLWLPPSLPYYELDGPFADPALKKFTKSLVFSSWRMVPRMIASLTSYEAERNMVGLFDPSIRRAELRKKLGRLLDLSRSEKGERLAGMPILGIIYPCITFARACDPLRMSSDPLPSAIDAIHRAEIEIKRLLQPIVESSPEFGLEDYDWYWAAPILLDMKYHKGYAEKFFLDKKLAEILTGEEISEEEEQKEKHLRWKEAIAEIVSLIEGKIKLKRPPRDLSTVLAKMAIAGPGTACCRALARVTDGLATGNLWEPLNDISLSAMRMSWLFIRLFNLPTSNALLRGLYKSDSQSAPAYWRQVLDYCLDGGLQAVMDEYVHFLKESEGIFGLDRGNAACKIAETVEEAMSLNASTFEIDDIRCNAPSGSISVSQEKMRTNFAVMLSEKGSEEGRSVNRISQVRKAFNSPFWPFVLATTSIGQEGLDFHAYCHAVVHWNLPSNPVDLEQREGRIHRFKGHAIRKNLASRYGLSEIGLNDADPWEALFMAGKRDRKDGSGDLVPFWIYTEGEYAFRWNEIPGKDNARLAEILTQKFGIDWAKTAKIEKTEKGKAIKVSTEKNSLSLKIIDKEIEVFLEIDGGRTDKLIAKMENDVLNIYSEGEAKIERHVPALPLSRDRERMEQLQKSLVVYRMVFGQSRQEDLAAFLMSRLDKVDMDKLRIDLSPPRRIEGAGS